MVLPPLMLLTKLPVFGMVFRAPLIHSVTLLPVAPVHFKVVELTDLVLVVEALSVIAETGWAARRLRQAQRKSRGSPRFPA